eukprot:PITA_18260
MDIAFMGEKDKFVLIYLDDITVYSSNHRDHLQHLRKVFLKCRRFGISVNPKKSQFALEEGKLLGHIVSAAGVNIDLERVKAIQSLFVPRSKKDIQSFLGKINFVRRFIPNFVELVKHITSMLRKGSKIKWTDAARRSFEAIERVIMEAHTLISSDYSKAFHIFSFASRNTLATVLLQTNGEVSEHPVSFFNKTLRDAELRCQRFEGKQQLKSLPLKPMHASGPFQQWGFDFIGEINPHSSGHHRWILVATDYFIKWIESIPTRKADHHVVMKFLTENIFIRFGCPHKLVTDNTTSFREKELVDMCDSMGIRLVHSTSYYPQGNGLVESSNKSLIRIIKKLLEDNKKNWDSKLKFALWADRVTTKKSIGNSPLKLVYGTEAVFPI